MGSKRTLLVATADMDAELLAAARALLWDVFSPEMTEDDWRHCLGGVHALVSEGSELVGHGAVVARRLFYAGRGLSTGYIEGVAVRADRRGRGYGAMIMSALESLVHDGYGLGALGATDEAAGFYEARGWQLWRGPTSAVTPEGIVRTPEDDGGIFVLPVSVGVDVEAGLTCDWREGDLW